MQLLIDRRTDVYPWLAVKTLLESPLRVLLHQEEAADETEISVVVCDDAFIQMLNASYRSIDRPTDVLSFPQDDSAFLGDIVISLETAARQADAARWPLESEVILLAMHGLLHLLGYDDETVAGAVEMRDLTKQALRDAGIALPPGDDHPFFTDYDE